MKIGLVLEGFDPLQVYDPETVDSFEVGLKSSWLDQRARSSASSRSSSTASTSPFSTVPSTSVLTSRPVTS